MKEDKVSPRDPEEALCSLFDTLGFFADSLKEIEPKDHRVSLFMNLIASGLQDISDIVQAEYLLYLEKMANDLDTSYNE